MWLLLAKKAKGWTSKQSRQAPLCEKSSNFIQEGVASDLSREFPDREIPGKSPKIHSREFFSIPGKSREMLGLKISKKRQMVAV